MIYMCGLKYEALKIMNKLRIRAMKKQVVYTDNS